MSVDTFQIVSEPRRREILRLVWDHELSAGEIAARFPLTFGAVSQHLGILREAGFLTVRRSGQQRFYRTDRERLGPLAPLLEAMWSEALDRLVESVEADAAAAPEAEGPAVDA